MSLAIRHFGKELDHCYLVRKVKLREKITLPRNDKILSDDDKVAKTLNNFFSNNVKNLDIFRI